MDKPLPTFAQQLSTHRLTWLYILALSAIALLTLSGQILIQWSLYQQLSDSHVINIAGRQRMLSQRLSKTVLAIQLTPTIDKRLEYIEELRETLNLWEQSHLGLQFGDPERNLPGRNSSAVVQLFARIQPHHQEMVNTAKKLLLLLDEKSLAAIDISPYIYRILDEEAIFLKGMNEIVFQYDAEASAKVNRVRIIELILASIALLVLLLEALYVFRPATRKIERTVANLFQAQKQIQESEERFRRLSEVTLEGLAIHDQGNILDANQSLLGMFQYELAELKDKNLRDLICVENETKLDETSTFCLGIRKEGSTFPIEVISTNMPYQERVISVTAIRDVTERKQADKALHESEEMLRALLNTIPECAFLMDIRDGTVLSSNETIAKRLGTTSQELVGSCFFGFLPPDVANSRREYVNLVRRTGKPVRFEDIRDNKYFDSSFYPVFNDEGELTRLAVFTVDITESKIAQAEIRKLNEELEQRVIQRTRELEVTNSELQTEIAARKQVEMALQQERTLLAERVAERTLELSEANAKLLQAMRTKDEFLASMSHELRTPLTAILGMTEGLLEEIYGKINEKQNKSLLIIEESGRHLLSLINDILDLSKIEAGKLELEIHPVAVETICRSSLQLIKQTARQKKLSLFFYCEDDTLTIHADDRRLKQILVNLLSNAIKFTSEGGEVSLTVNPDPLHHIIHFIVQDTGIGIAQENLGKLFKPFVQLDSRLSRKYGGIGLGLSLVYRLTEMHGGSISVESEVGRGSCFTISLPWHGIAATTKSLSENSQVLDLPSSNAKGLMQKNVSESSPLLLLAEDNEATIETLSHYLLAKNYRLVVAHNGAEAIDLAKATHPHLILMDIQMPVIDGLEAIRRLRTEPEFSTIPIIALTALVMPSDKEQCLAAGANEYLSKPVMLHKLVEIIEEHLNH